MGGARAFPTWWAQYAALSRKHWLLARRNPRATATQLGMGAIVVGLLIGFQLLADQLLGFEVPHPLVAPIGALPACRALAHSRRVDSRGALFAGECNTLLYAPRSVEVETVLRRVSDNAGLD